MSSSLNRAMLIGNLTRDPELKKTTGGQSVCSFSIATNRAYTDAQGVKHDQADYHNLVAWGRLAEICGQYLTKGKKIYADGRLQTREWDGQDGQKKYRTEIVLENMVMLGGGPGRGEGGMEAPSYEPITSSSQAPAPTFSNTPSGVPDQEIKLEDIPF